MTIDSGSFPAPAALVEHARRFRAEGGVPAVPRVAATVLLLRPADAGFEVYMIRRVAAMTFGGMYAFPGGGVDPSDAQAHPGWAGPEPEEWGRRLGVPPEAARAVVCAAAREVFEEAGVLLAGPTTDRDQPGPETGTAPDRASGSSATTSEYAGASPTTVVGDVSGDDWEAARVDLEQRRTHFAEFLTGRGLTLRSDLLLPWSRWVTPEFEPRRFDTYFFVALLPEGQRTRDVSGEADHTLWVRPADALRRAAAGELTMLPPTLLTLEQVAAAGDLADVARIAADRDAATPITPRLAALDTDTPYFTLD
ncbi:NUDIX hydrolase [Micromonospora cathayae]|uniref:NUDIX hydrolase n=1 Tax=Micromonospora cathayae TaxID=3028804 RepID=A0ABY7ZT54_9ACTN|nr:NUDIX hydrolase [Micromonospora sp. HUAS 3]WDZ85571.1 NUDIX hydrolase [Micromonospora sp. HUAS 3]